MKIIKRALMKAKESKLDPYMAILCVNSTPVDSKLPSPGEMLYSRIIQDNLPRKINRDRTADEIIDRFIQRQERDKFYHNRNVKTLPPLVCDQAVNVKNPISHKWEPATIDKPNDYPRSYNIRTQSGKTLRRNRTALRESNQIRKEVRFSPDIEKSENTRISQEQDNPRTKIDKLTPISKPAIPRDCEIGNPVITRSGRAITPPKRMDF